MLRPRNSRILYDSIFQKCECYEPFLEHSTFRCIDKCGNIMLSIQYSVQRTLILIIYIFLIQTRFIMENSFNFKKVVTLSLMFRMNDMWLINFSDLQKLVIQLSSKIFTKISLILFINFCLLEKSVIKDRSLCRSIYLLKNA